MQWVTRPVPHNIRSVEQSELPNQWAQGRRAAVVQDSHLLMSILALKELYIHPLHSVVLWMHHGVRGVGRAELVNIENKHLPEKSSLYSSIDSQWSKSSYCT